MSTETTKLPHLLPRQMEEDAAAVQARKARRAEFARMQERLKGKQATSSKDPSARRPESLRQDDWDPA